MYRVELKADALSGVYLPQVGVPNVPCGVESIYGDHHPQAAAAVVPNVPCGVESNEIVASSLPSYSNKFLMYRVELKGLLFLANRTGLHLVVPNVPCGVESWAKLKAGVVLGYNSFYEVFMGEFIVGVGFGSSFWV